MYLLGDIGNSETKLCLVSKKNKILKKIIFSTKDINQKKLEKNFKNLKIDYKKIEKILFCSVVPKSFNLIKKYLFKKIKVRCYEVKNLGLKSLIKIKVNYKQVGSDRITNAISLMNNKDNFIILDFYPFCLGIDNVIANMHIKNLTQTNISIFIQLDGKGLAAFQCHWSFGDPVSADQVTGRTI